MVLVGEFTWEVVGDPIVEDGIWCLADQQPWKHFQSQPHRVQSILQPEVLELHLWGDGIFWCQRQCSVCTDHHIEEWFDLRGLVARYDSNVHCCTRPRQRLFEEPCELVRGFVSGLLPHTPDLLVAFCGATLSLGRHPGKGLSLWRV